MPSCRSSLLAALLAANLTTAFAVQIDTYDEREDSGIFARRVQKQVDLAVILGTTGAALWQGTETAAGLTAWRATDAMLATAGTTEAMKHLFQRARPSQGDNPDRWFAGSSHRSFPSGETAMMAAAVTPWILTYRDSNAWVWTAAALPVYMGYARMQAQGHWLTDVLVGSAIGTAWGWKAARAPQPWVLSWTGDGMFVGWRQHF